MLTHNPDNNLLGSEQGKKVKFRVVKNSWIDVEDYSPEIGHELLYDIGYRYILASTKIVKTDLKIFPEFLRFYGVKRVMILSRK